MPHTRFPKEFQDEAVRLALTSGRSRREIAQDLGVDLSTLRHWIDRRRESEIDHPPEERHDNGARWRGYDPILSKAAGYASGLRSDALGADSLALCNVLRTSLSLLTTMHPVVP